MASPITSMHLAVSLAGLVAINLVPLFGVMFLGWSVFEVMLVFWVENLVIGFFALLRLIFGSVARRELSGLVLVPNLLMTLVPFTAAHGFFVLMMFGPPPPLIPGHDPILRIFSTLFDQHWMLWPLIGMALCHSAVFVLNFLIGGEIRSVKLEEWVGRPIARVMLLHVVIVFGGWAVLATGAHVAALVVLVALKTTIEVLTLLRQPPPAEAAQMSTVPVRAKTVPRRKQKRK